MMNALQGVDVLLNGLDRGIAAAAESFRADRELARAQEANSAAAWEKYARALLDQNRLLQTHLSALQDKFEELADTYVQERNGYSDYVAELLFKIQTLTAELERKSAYTHAYGKMRDRLIAQLAQFTDPERTPLLKPQEMQAQLRKDWNDFMKNQVIPARKPLPIRAIVPRKDDAAQGTAPRDTAATCKPLIPAAQALYEQRKRAGRPG